MALQAVLKGGDHLLMTDAAYSPARRFAEQVLRPLRHRDDVLRSRARAPTSPTLIRPNTRAVLTEAPGSQSLGYAGHPGHRQGRLTRTALCVMMDNTWATPILFFRRTNAASTSPSRPAPNICRAIPICCSASSRPIPNGGRDCAPIVDLYAIPPGPDDCLSGAARPAHDGVAAEASPANGRRWRSRVGCRSRPEVKQRAASGVATSMSGMTSGNAIFSARPACSASCLQPGVRTPRWPRCSMAWICLVSASRWGGYESLIIPFDCTQLSHGDRNGRRAARHFASKIGLEDPADLMADLEARF